MAMKHLINIHYLWASRDEHGLELRPRPVFEIPDRRS